MSIVKTTTDIPTLKINYLTQDLYDNALLNNQINEDELYITLTESDFITYTDKAELMPLTSISVELEDSFYVGEFVVDGDIWVENIDVLFDGVEYNCIGQKKQWGSMYGATFDDTTGTIDFSIYPFCIIGISGGEYGEIATQTEGPHTLKLDGAKLLIDSISPGFKAALNYIIDPIRIDGGSY